jgi:hypothetical protein
MARPLTFCLVLVAVAAGAACPAAGAAARTRGVTYGGMTSAHVPLVITLSADGKHVVKMADMWTAPCTAGGTMTIGGAIATKLDVDSHGRFAAEGSKGVTVGGDRTWFLEQHATGTVNGHAMSGTWTVDLRRYDTTGALADSCATSFTYRARAAAGRIYGGVTSQDLPVVVTVAPGRTKVRRIDFGWSSTCRSDTFIQFPDTVSNFRLVGGRFRGVFGASDKGSQGEELRLAYAVRGSVTRARVSGRMSVRFTVHDATGNLTDSCASGAFSYTASSG